MSKYIHAQPVYLTSECIVAGPPEFDLNLSAINYFLWNEEALHIAGVVFGEEKTFESGIQYGRPKAYDLTIRYNQDVITLSYKNNKGKVVINGKTPTDVRLGTGQINSANLTDATVLQFDFILKSGQIASVDSLVGETFELLIPWERLKSKPTNESSQALISIASKGSRLQTPLSGDPDSGENWLVMKINKKGK